MELLKLLIFFGIPMIIFLKMGYHLKKYNDYSFRDYGGLNIARNISRFYSGEKSNYEKNQLKKAGICFVLFAIYLILFAAANSILDNLSDGEII